MWVIYSGMIIFFFCTEKKGEGKEHEVWEKLQWIVPVLYRNRRGDYELLGI